MEKFVNMSFLEKDRKERESILKKTNCPFWRELVYASGDAVCDVFREKYPKLSFVVYECSNGAKFVWCAEKRVAIVVTNKDIPKMEYPKKMEKKIGFLADANFLGEAFDSK